MTIEFSIQNCKKSESEKVKLHNHANGIFSIQISDEDNSNTLSDAIIEQILKVLDIVQNDKTIKVLIIKGTEKFFLTGGRKELNQAIEKKLYQRIVSFPYPVIAAIQGEATGAGFLIGILSDFMICCQDGKYSFVDNQKGLYPSSKEELLFYERLGEVRASDFLFCSTIMTGRQLKEKEWDCPILSKEEIEDTALTLASNLVQKSQTALNLLKLHLARKMIKLTDQLTYVEPIISQGRSETIKSSKISSSKQIQIESHANNVLVLRILDGKENYTLKTLTDDLTNIFTQVREGSQYRSIILLSKYNGFLPEKEITLDVVRDFKNLILESPFPVIAALEANASGISWFLCQFFDACIYNENGHYSTVNVRKLPGLSMQVIEVFSHRFGKCFGEEVLLTENEYTGCELKQRLGTINVAKENQVLSRALQLAESWTNIHFESLISWKKRSALRIKEKMEKLPKCPQSEAKEIREINNNPFTLKLNSKVVSGMVYPNGILVVKMEDRKAKNMFSDEIINGVNEIFEHIEKTQLYKVVVLTGYDHYFASGGTKENLLAIQNGKAKFTDVDIYPLAMRCKIPVIAAMQGHGIGGGWSLGMFADLILFSEESKYFSPYMNYGFTPGAGATLIFPDKIGYDLSRDTLLTGKEYSGKELKDKGLVLPVIPREKVFSAAMLLAESISKNSRSYIMSVKNYLNQHLEKSIGDIYKLELTMHEKTFVGKSDTLKQINERFIQKDVHQKSETTIDEKIINVEDNIIEYSLPEITSTLKDLLAKELQMQKQDIDDDIQFVDLGLDSITSVTWMRKINENYKTKIEAIKVYGYPTLTKLSRYVKSEVDKKRKISDKTEIKKTTDSNSQSAEQKSTVEIKMTNKNIGLSEIITNLKELLAQELQLQVQDIDEDTQFIDLGMDSITGVTWIRKINEKYNTTIHATKVYSYPTLVKLSRYVKDEAGKKINLQKDNPVKMDLNVKEFNQAEIQSSLKELLAIELQMETQEIDEETQFVDLGLDSITSVTWVRKINEKYKTKIEATKVYNYPTLKIISAYVKNEIEKQSPQIQKINDNKSIDLVSTDWDKAESVNENTIDDINILSSITSTLKSLLAQELQMSDQEIDQDAKFIDLGLDSITGVTWMRKVNEKYKITIEATKVYSYPTLTLLSRYVKEQVNRQNSLNRKIELKKINLEEIPKISQNKYSSRYTSRKLISWRDKRPLKEISSTNIKTSSSPTINQLQAIAVIGMAGQFPQAKNLEEFWNNIAQRKNCIEEIPQKRWDINKFYKEGNPSPGKTNCKWMGLLEEYDLFDPLFFNISPIEAISMDPQQRIFLQSCWHAIESAGYNPKDLSGSKCGIFVGCTTGDYLDISKEHKLSASGFTGGAISILAARIAYYLNLQGPCISIDTACSSSLVSIASACDSLAIGSSDIVLAGGVYVGSGPTLHIMSSQSGMLSKNGQCFTFDQRANGFVPGEGVGVVMLKRISDAQRDQDKILGVIQGWGINQDGKTNGITAPNPEAQTRLQQEVYNKYQINPENIQLIEAHGTGTKLGDPIEVDALKQSFTKYTQKTGYCALSSVKSNIGHLGTAAGVAGLIKLILALKYKKLPPTINFDQLNEHIDLKDSPFYVNDRLQDWELNGNKMRQAAINAFGFSGTNAHIVVAEYQPQIEEKSDITNREKFSKEIILLSARTAEQLKQKVIDLLEYVSKVETSINLSNLAYTLKIGREAMEERLGFIVESVDQLTEKLKAFIDGKQNEGLFISQVKRNKDILTTFVAENNMQQLIDNWIKTKNLSKIVEFWVKGLEFDWKKMYGDVKPRRISLPLYPFAKERYWIEDVLTEQHDTTGKQASVIHPLVHINTSNFYQQSYCSTFNGEETFLKDHQIHKQRILPGVAYLEMARVAVENALSIQPEQTAIELRNIVWIQPVIVNKNKQINIVLNVNESDNSLEEIDFEMYSEDNGQEVVHCQGQVKLKSKQSPLKNDIESLKNQMGLGQFDSNCIYPAFTKIGFNYGPAHQTIKSMLMGENQLLAFLHLPSNIDTGNGNYILHPSIMDGALQASIGLISDMNQIPTHPTLPFSLDTMRIMSGYTNEMVAWLRYSQGRGPEDKIIKIDVDLCDKEGNICVQMIGFTSRILENEFNQKVNSTNNNIENKEIHPSSSDAFYQKLIADIMNNKVSIDEALELV